MIRLTRDGAAESASRDQILRRERGQENIHFPCSADHVEDWQPYPVDPYSTIISDDHTYKWYNSLCFTCKLVSSAYRSNYHGDLGCSGCEIQAQSYWGERHRYRHVINQRSDIHNLAGIKKTHLNTFFAGMRITIKQQRKQVSSTKYLFVSIPALNFTCNPRRLHELSLQCCRRGCNRDPPLLLLSPPCFSSRRLTWKGT